MANGPHVQYECTGLATLGVVTFGNVADPAGALAPSTNHGNSPNDAAAHLPEGRHQAGSSATASPSAGDTLSRECWKAAFARYEAARRPQPTPSQWTSGHDRPAPPKRAESTPCEAAFPSNPQPCQLASPTDTVVSAVNVGPQPRHESGGRSAAESRSLEKLAATFSLPRFPNASETSGLSRRYWILARRSRGSFGSQRRPSVPSATTVSTPAKVACDDCPTCCVRFKENHP